MLSNCNYIKNTRTSRLPLWESRRALQTSKSSPVISCYEKYNYSKKFKYTNRFINVNLTLSKQNQTCSCKILVSSSDDIVALVAMNRLKILKSRTIKHQK